MQQLERKSKWNMHVEIITNVVPGYNDDTEELRVKLLGWIVQNLGDETPWHLSRFYPYLESVTCTANANFYFGISKKNRC